MRRRLSTVGLQMDRLPNFFIVGAPKAGTSSLHAYLGAAPEIFMSRLKEPNYFSRIVVPDDHPVRPVRDRQRYLQLFSEASTESVVGEASPTYLADPEAPLLISQMCPDAKILISLRDPVERAYSHYLMMLNNGAASDSFLEEVKRGLASQHNRKLMLLRPEIGLYHQQLKRYMHTFDERYLKIIIFEELAGDPKGILLEIMDFLQIDDPLDNFHPEVYRQYGEPRGGFARYLFGNRTISRLAELLISSRARKWMRENLLMKPAAKPSMDAEARKFLTEYYAEDVRTVTELLGRRVPWRNFLD